MARSSGLQLVMRFAPDILIVGIALMISITGKFKTAATSFYLYHLIPLCFNLSLVTLFMQSGATRGGLWRRVCESRLMMFFGYISYPMYILHPVLLNFYARIIYDEVQSGFDPAIGSGNYGLKPRPYLLNKWIAGMPLELKEAYVIPELYWDNFWFRKQEDWWKPLGLLGLMFVCWLVQKYLQDTLVASIYSWVVGLIAKEKAAQRKSLAEDDDYLGKMREEAESGKDRSVV